MHLLDDRSFVERLDRSGMLRLTEAFPDQCRQAKVVAEQSKLPVLASPPSSVILAGVGGSAAGGDFVRAIFDEAGSCPFFVNREYKLPAYVDASTLVFAVSYSGNTEETLSAYADATRKGATVIAVTTGGTLADLARQNGDSLVTVPGGQPPRTALGYLFVPVLHACANLGLVGAQDFDGAFSLLDECVRGWSVPTPYDKNRPKQLADQLHGKLSVIYGLGAWQGAVANRWKGQINENAKNMTFANAFPELCHNEILGWVRANDQGVREWIGVMLKDGSESLKMQKRAEVTESLLSEKAVFHHVLARGDTLLEKMLSLALFGDFVSLYLAALNAVDPENIDSINVLKKELANVP
jgi:glucose/mannose-6-phosphate isomerase